MESPVQLPLMAKQRKMGWIAHQGWTLRRYRVVEWKGIEPSTAEQEEERDQNENQEHEKKDGGPERGQFKPGAHYGDDSISGWRNFDLIV